MLRGMTIKCEYYEYHRVLRHFFARHSRTIQACIKLSKLLSCGGSSEIGIAGLFTSYRHIGSSLAQIHLHSKPKAHERAYVMQ